VQVSGEGREGERASADQQKRDADLIVTFSLGRRAQQGDDTRRKRGEGRAGGLAQDARRGDTKNDRQHHDRHRRPHRPNHNGCCSNSRHREHEVAGGNHRDSDAGHQQQRDQPQICPPKGYAHALQSGSAGAKPQWRNLAARKDCVDG
jgi:hypothetical protein